LNQALVAAFTLRHPQESAMSPADLFRRRRAFHQLHADADVDLVPMIDCIFLLLLFFMLCGRLTTDNRPEQITVPPTKTATKIDEKSWPREVINVSGSTQRGQPPRAVFAIGPHRFVAEGWDDYHAYSQVRALFDEVYARADTYADPAPTGLRLPRVLVQIRADADTEYRVVQELQQILSDSIDPATMLPNDTAVRRPFTHIEFTTRRPDDR
jgi:biopolymer transport protein ExbD